MNQEVEVYLKNYSEEIQNLFGKLRELIMNSVEASVEEKLWAKLPSYYVGDRFVRLIPFKDHINIEADQIVGHKAALEHYKITPKGMVQLYLKDQIPEKELKQIFQETLQ